MGKFTQTVLAVSLEPKVEPIKLVEKGSIKINSNDTSTTTTKIKDCTFTMRDNCLYYFICKKSQTPTNGYFCQENFGEAYYASNSDTNLLCSMNGIKTLNNNNLPSKSTSTGVGIFATVSNGKMGITKKYNQYQTPNWAGTYDYKIYEIDLSKLGE